MNTPLIPRVLLVEDDTVCGSLLQICVQRANGLPIGPARTAEQALELYVHDKPDLVVLDVYLDGPTDGVALAKQLRFHNPNIPLLFITSASDDDTYQRAQQLQPVMFVLKPFNPLAVKRLVEEVFLQISALGQSLTISEVPVLPPPHRTATGFIGANTFADGITARPALLTGKEKIFVRENGRLVRLTIEQIVSVQTDNKYCVLTMSNGRRHSVRTPLFELLQDLQPADFLRVHRSWLVNLTHIETIALAEAVVCMSDGSEVPLGRVYRDELIQRVRLVE